jgi:hypothetical protein
MTSKECDDLIDKAVASGVLDSSGDLNFNMRGSREEIIAGILGRCAAWNMPMTRFSAERLADSALRVIRRRRWLWVMWIAIPLILAMAVLFTIVAARRAILDEETSPSQSLASTMALRYPDCVHIVEGRQRGAREWRRGGRPAEDSPDGELVCGLC